MNVLLPLVLISKFNSPKVDTSLPREFAKCSISLSKKSHLVISNGVRNLFMKYIMISRRFSPPNKQLKFLSFRLTKSPRTLRVVGKISTINKIKRFLLLFRSSRNDIRFTRLENNICSSLTLIKTRSLFVTRNDIVLLYNHSLFEFLSYFIHSRAIHLLISTTTIIDNDTLIPISHSVKLKGVTFRRSFIPGI